ncbi:MAG TPA: hypothetical protein PLC91_00520 [Candidatus Cloacimonadota bacterium]|nr:hypothetical protein [Candidatus Cloacimonadota bacterium]HQH50338.1 hypothetical protein [Candidatus Cloacimonadota bacterium]
MRLEAATLQIWPEFRLELPAPLEFQTGFRYHLRGFNGSGKSSFLSRVLLPRLNGNFSCYSLYFEQQMSLQLDAVRAYAALRKTRQLLASEKDVIDFLLRDLFNRLQEAPRPAYVLMDESPHTSFIADSLQEQAANSCLIYTSHQEGLPNSICMDFKLLEPGLGRVLASPA